MKKWKIRSMLGAVAVTTALSVTALTGATAFAAEPGEWNDWQAEYAGNQQVTSRVGVSESRDPNGNHAIVSANGNNQVQVSYNGAAAYTWTNTTTYATPRIIWTAYGWRVFHTGTDQHIYYAGFTISYDGHLTLGSWQQVPGNVTTSEYSPAAVTNLTTNNGEEWMLSWRGLDNNIYTQYHQRTTSMAFPGHFDTPQRVPNATSNLGPGITFTPLDTYWAHNGCIYIVWTGTNGQVYSSWQAYGSPTWSAPSLVGLNHSPGFVSPPAIGIEPNGQGQVAVRDANGHVQISPVDVEADFVPGMGSFNWRQESTYWVTNADPWISVAGYALYLILSATNGYPWNPVYYKQSGTY
ncbi:MULTISPECIES: hypothetical protein [Streptomyces]|uniref:Uncharacterized protein n=1 Tax=Streptomyces flaveolus TaxID=67297 RepID=A0ABV3ARV6_9ACTN|nr:MULTISPECIES: hypothetical protein [Streptomyces]